jgi:hypothetical protein
VNRGNIDPYFFENPPMHDRHNAAAATVTLPGAALKSAGRLMG